MMLTFSFANCVESVRGEARPEIRALVRLDPLEAAAAEAGILLVAHDEILLLALRVDDVDGADRVEVARAFTVVVAEVEFLVSLVYHPELEHQHLAAAL